MAVFINTRSGFRACLDIVRYSRKAGATVGIWHQKACDNANQLWELDSSAVDSSTGTHIRSALRDDFLLTAVEHSTGGTVEMHSERTAGEEGASCQRWSLSEDGHIISQADGALNGLALSVMHQVGGGAAGGGVTETKLGGGPGHQAVGSLIGLAPLAAGAGGKGAAAVQEWDLVLDPNQTVGGGGGAGTGSEGESASLDSNGLAVDWIGVAALLRPKLKERRVERMEAVARSRSRHVALVLENCSDPRNASACLRTADLLGIQDIHVIESYDSFNVDETVSKGAGRWLTLHHYSSAADCIGALHRKGFKVYASDLNPTAVSIDEIGPLNAGRPVGAEDVGAELPFGGREKVAVLFGNESRGISDVVRRMADQCFVLPMSGFGQSFNLSVACSLTLYHLRMAAVLTPSANESEICELLAKWLCRDVPQSRKLLTSKGFKLPDF